jgi:hypothetical protein
MNSLPLSLLRETVDLRMTISMTIPTLVDLITDKDFDFNPISTLAQLAEHGTSHLNVLVPY